MNAPDVRRCLVFSFGRQQGRLLLQALHRTDGTCQPAWALLTVVIDTVDGRGSADRQIASAERRAAQQRLQLGAQVGRAHWDARATRRARKLKIMTTIHNSAPAVAARAGGHQAIDQRDRAPRLCRHAHRPIADDARVNQPDGTSPDSDTA